MRVRFLSFVLVRPIDWVVPVFDTHRMSKHVNKWRGTYPIEVNSVCVSACLSNNGNKKKRRFKDKRKKRI